MLHNSTKALQLACRFALPPNSLGYCGRDSAPERFKTCISTGKCETIEEELSNFIVLTPYLRTIAEITGLSPFSYEVIESYSIGNDLLHQAKPEHYDLLLDNFSKQGVPSWFVDELREKRPKKFIPHHLFQILHVGVGKASGAVPFNLESINSCMIRWGEVQEIRDTEVDVHLVSLERNSEYTTTMLKETVPFSPDLIPGLKPLDTVAVHWQQVIKHLTKHETKNLSFWTNRVLQTIH